MVKKFTIFLLVAVIASGMAFSWNGQTGSINGVVKTPEGDPFPGVIVLLRSPALIVPEVEALTNKEGIYRFPGLSPGVYELSFIVRGLETYVKKGISVSAGITVSLDIDLPLRAEMEAVVVEEKAPKVARMKIKGVSVLDSSILQTVQDYRDDSLMEIWNGRSFRTGGEDFRNRCQFKDEALPPISDFIGFGEPIFQSEPHLGPTEWGYCFLIDLSLQPEKHRGIGQFNLKAFRDVFNVFKKDAAASFCTLSDRPEFDMRYTFRMIPTRIFQLGDRIEF
jgi:hypothetical protein